jgi:hypothetical protein
VIKRKLTLTTLLVIGGFFLTTHFFTQTYRSISSYSEATSPVVLVQATEANIDSSIPKKLYPCLPRKVEKLKLLGSTVDADNTYYLVGVYQALQSVPINEAPPPTYEETLVKLDNLGCLVVVPKEKKVMASLTRYVPESVARSLSLQKHRKKIVDAGGKQKFEQSFNEDREEGGETVYLFPEDVWALKQLGINIPSNVRVITDVEEL